MARDPGELRQATDESIADAPAQADSLVLRGLVYQLAGDDDLVDIDLASVVIGGNHEVFFWN